MFFFQGPELCAADKERDARQEYTVSQWRVLSDVYLLVLRLSSISYCSLKFEDPETHGPS